MFVNVVFDFGVLSLQLIVCSCIFTLNTPDFRIISSIPGSTIVDFKIPECCQQHLRRDNQEEATNLPVTCSLSVSCHECLQMRL